MFADARPSCWPPPDAACGFANIVGQVDITRRCIPQVSDIAGFDGPIREASDDLQLTTHGLDAAAQA
ncbi:MAG: hypothetical protein KGO85_05070 [Proteobacteria bacterium]|nr:hypothetical protein [Pseudomonadota bacterium]